MINREPFESEEKPFTSELKFLKPGVIATIEHALNKVGSFGEVHLVLERGQLRFIRTITSESIDRAKS